MEKQNEMTAEHEGAILERAIETFGENAQVDKMIEEMSELTRALLTARRVRALGYDLPDDYRQDILEEVADCYIMLNQMCLIYGDDSEWEEYKLQRLEASLAKLAETDNAV